MKFYETPQRRRLKHELELMRVLESQSSLIEFHAAGDAPVRYDLELRCNGLTLVDRELTISGLHRFTITLDADFPLTAPQIVWHTPIFHPNMHPPAVCYGDTWFPGSNLADLCETLCDMVQLKIFNLDDPLDRNVASALVEAVENWNLHLPVDDQSLRDLDAPLRARLRQESE